MTTEAENRQIEAEFDEWIKCWQCGGIGMTPGCFEDFCSGSDCDPDDAELCCNPHTCDVCKGKGGWEPNSDE